MEVDEGSDQKSDIYPHWMAAHVYLKNELTEDRKCQNLMSSLKAFSYCWSEFIKCVLFVLEMLKLMTLLYVSLKIGWCNWLQVIYEPRHDKTNKMSVHPAKTQISLGICPVWSESSLSAWRKLGSLATHWAHSEDSDQTGRMPRLIWVFAGRIGHFVGFVVRRLIYH